MLDDAGVHRILEAAQCDADTSVMQTPKVTVFNGQDADFNTIDTEDYVTGAEVHWDGDKVTVLPKKTTVETGLHLSVLPVVSPDRGTVKMHFEAALRELAHKKVSTLPVSTLLTPLGGKGELAPFVQAIQMPKVLTHTLDRTLCIPDGKTALLDGIQRPAEHEGECDPPCITKIPYIKRLFKNVGGKSLRTLVLVTPRVIAPVEEEKKG